ncbi:dihydropyrimidinase [Psychrobacillus sp. INOP01]|uniref:dihydropyrimidinase n=1 Tax=Psychrobacillus sp. INOP01 TaxID=2829187 RepID=UPI001BAB81DD|nr:dihydropyrimidinase [Psychrobacillus sp. INOP01]QUG40617.1 dihydropyrimidinase [Psychrobacillus sp. INOP01]
MKKTIIKNGILVTSEKVVQEDLLIEDGKIKKIGAEIEDIDAEIIQAEGNYVFPGGVDAHTHFDLQSGIHRTVDNYYTASIAAACGGTTTIIDHLSFGPVNCSLQHRVDEYHNLASGKSVIDYSFHSVIQHVNNKILNEIDELIAEGITSFKIYMTYDFKLLDYEILQVMQKIKEVGGVLTVHAENHGIIETLRKKFISEKKIEPIFHAKSRPDYCEAEAIWRLIQLAEVIGDVSLYIVHLSSKKGLDILNYAKQNGYNNVFVETCPQYLTLTDEKYLESDGLKYVMSPPLRKKHDLNALWEGLSNNSIDVIGTDHCPFLYSTDKQDGKNDFTMCPNGVPGVEERFRLIFSEGVVKKRITLQQFVNVISTNPAKIFGLYPKKGDLKVGFDADIVIFNPNIEEKISINKLHSSADYSVYEGVNVTGRIECVLQRGNILFQKGEFRGLKGQGEFIKRSPQRKSL